MAITIALLPAAGLCDRLDEFLQAAEDGDAKSQFIVGLSFEGNEREAQDFRQAVAWYERSAAQGFGPAKAALGYLYQTGMGVSQDDREAFELYRRAAEAGDMGGQFLLGVAYVNGIGTPVDAALAARWLHASAEAGHQQAQLMLATMLQSGTGTAKNEFAARRWFGRAASGPDRDIAATAADLRQQIDDRVLFSGAFRPNEMAAILAIGFGLAALMANVPPGTDAGYDHRYYHPMQDPQERINLCISSIVDFNSSAGCL